MSVEKEGSYLGNCGNARGVHRDLGRADLVPDLLTVKAKKLLSVNERDRKGNAGERRNDGFGILGGDPVLLHVKSDRAVHGAGIDVEDAELLCNCLGNAAFSGTAGAVECNFYL